MGLVNSYTYDFPVLFCSSQVDSELGWPVRGIHCQRWTDWLNDWLQLGLNCQLIYSTFHFGSRTMHFSYLECNIVNFCESTWSCKYGSCVCLPGDSPGMVRGVLLLPLLSQHSDVASSYKSNYYLHLPVAKIKTNTKITKIIIKKTKWDKLQGRGFTKMYFSLSGLAFHFILNCSFIALQTSAESVSQKWFHSMWARFYSFLFVIKVQLGWEL